MSADRPGTRLQLSSARIWLSGAIPEEFESRRPDDAERIRTFVRLLAREVFDRGGTIVHGSHPSIRPLLLEEARAFRDRTRSQTAPDGLKAPLHLVVSEWFASDPARHDIDVSSWQSLCAEKVAVTPAVPVDVAGEDRARDRSLSIMRRTLAGMTNVIVAVGGKWWADQPQRAGVPEEIDYARDNLIPLFLLGGLGGATRTWLEQHPEYVAICANGLTNEENLDLAASVDLPRSVDRVVDQIAVLHEPSASAVRGVSRGNDPPAHQGAGKGNAQSATEPPFRRILCLDGGGVRGAFTAKVLADWQRITGLMIADHFDLIVGTSTGGILAIGLGMGLEPAAIVDFYRDHGPRIFPGEGLVGRWLAMKHWFAPKFDRKVLEQSIASALSRAPVTTGLLADAQVRLAITTYDAETDSPRVYRTPHIDMGRLDEHVTALEAAMATSAAPTYFDFTRIDYTRAIDGGVWANSPTLVALAEAALLGWDLKSVRVLSIGTLYTPNVLARPLEIDAKFIESSLRPVLGWWKAKLVSWVCKPIAVGGKLGWLPTIANLLMKTQAQAAERIAKTLLGNGANFVRVDFATPSISMDDAASIESLLSYGATAAEQSLSTVEKEFLIAGSPAQRWTRPVP